MFCVYVSFFVHFLINIVWVIIFTILFIITQFLMTSSDIKQMIVADSRYNAQGYKLKQE